MLHTCTAAERCTYVAIRPLQHHPPLQGLRHQLAQYVLAAGITALWKCDTCEVTDQRAVSPRVAFAIWPEGAWCMQVKSPMTMTEKILARHSDNTRVIPGQNIWTNVDKLMTHDVCGPGTFGIFQREFGENAQVDHPHALNTCVTDVVVKLCIIEFVV